MGKLEKTVESERTDVSPDVRAGSADATTSGADPEKLRKRRNNTAVMVLLGFDVLVGAAIGFVGYRELESDAVALAGTVLATIGLVLMLAYQLFGREK